jgi:hypothetical protein
MWSYTKNTRFYGESLRLGALNLDLSCMDVPIADLLSRRGSADNIALLDAFLAQAAAAKRDELEIAAANAAERAAQEPDAAADADAPPVAPASKLTAEDSRRSEELLRLVMFLFYSDKSLVEHCTEVLDSARIVECIGRVSRRRFWLVQSSSQVMLEIGCVIQLFTLIALARARVDNLNSDCIVVIIHG